MYNHKKSQKVQNSHDFCNYCHYFNNCLFCLQKIIEVEYVPLGSTSWDEQLDKADPCDALRYLGFGLKLDATGRKAASQRRACRLKH